MAAAITGTPVELALNANASPGAKAVTVPADAEYICVHFAFYADLDVDLSSLTSTCCGTFTVDKLSGSGGTNVGVGVAYAAVTSAGSKTVTIAWTRALNEGPIVWVTFVKGIDGSTPVLATGKNHYTGTAAPSVSVASQADALVIAMHEADTSNPATATGCTSQGTATVNGAGSRLQTVNSPGASSTTVTGGSTSYPTLGLISFKPAASGGATVTPANASLSYAGAAPTLSTRNDITVVLGNASLSFAGLLPLAQTIITAQPANASLSFQGAQPSIYLEMRVVPANASLSFQGQQAVMYLQNVVSPGNASLSFAGLQPVIQTDAGLVVAPDNASLSFQGLAPNVAQGITIIPGNASLSFAGAQPSLALTFEATTVTPDPASLSFQGLAPTINTASAVRGHHATGRRWRGRVYGLSYSHEVVLIPTVGRSDSQLPPPPPAPRVGLGEMAIPFVDPPRPSLAEADADTEGRYARLRDGARRRIEREIAASRERARRKRVQRAVAGWLEAEQSAIDSLTDLTKQLLALRAARRGSMTGRAR